MTKRLAALASAALLAAAACGSPAAAPTTTTVPAPTTSTVAPTTTAPPATTTTAAPTTTTEPPEPFDPLGATIPEMQQAMADGRITSLGLVDFYLARIAAYDRAGPALNALIMVNPHARADAAALDGERADSGPRGPLHGIPIVLKDNIDTVDLPTTAGSRSLAGFLPGDDAVVVQRLRAAGAVIIAKANLHEFARDITTISSLGGQTRNPYDPGRYPGGSSGGTGAALAAEFAAAGLGTDTCGSVRIPSAFNDLFGLRPTLGFVPTEGVIPLAPSEDTVGPMARHAVDLAILLDVMAGTSPTFADAAAGASLDGVRIGVLEPLFEGADPGVAATVRAALAEMEAAGATLVEVSHPGFDELRGTATALFLREFRDALDAYLDAHPGAPVHSLAEVVASGRYHPSLDARLRAHLTASTTDADYLSAFDRRAVVLDVILGILGDDDLDALAYPAIAEPPAPIGQTQHGSRCATASVAGLPAIVVPAGFDGGLPVGLELMGRPLSETTLVAIAAAYDAATDHVILPATTPGR
jgi:amidase